MFAYNFAVLEKGHFKDDREPTGTLSGPILQQNWDPPPPVEDRNCIRLCVFVANTDFS